MTVARVSIYNVIPGKKEEAEKLLDEFENFVSKEKGYILGFRFEGAEDPNDIGRIAVWESHRDIDRVATLNHVVVLRARLHRLIKPGHIEKVLVLKGKPKNIPSAS